MIERLDDLEFRVLKEMDVFCDRFQREVGDIRRRLALAKKDFDARAEELHEKLVAGPVDADELREHMVKKWNMTVESCMNDDWWVDITELRKKYPKWARAIVEGHYLPRDTFEQWGRELLMEEVRVNIQIKHIQDLRKIAKEKEAEEQKQLETQWEELIACGYYGC